MPFERTSSRSVTNESGLGDVQRIMPRITNPAGIALSLARNTTGTQ